MSELGSSETPRTRWQKIRLVIKVVELRLRFIALMAVTGLVFAYWDSLWNRYDKWMRPAGTQQTAAIGIEHYCPMHPNIVQSTAGSCPICGMPLAKRKAGEKETLPEGVTARVRLAAFRVDQAGIQTADVGYAPLAQTMTTVGYVGVDERRQATIPSKIPGKSRVETLHANYSGMTVQAGEPLAELYSPELGQAIQELLQNADRDGAPAQSAVGRSMQGVRRDLVRLSAEKLTRWGITQEQIDQILRSHKAEPKIPILSPISGTVIKKNVVQGQEVPEGYPMFEVADLSHVWITAQVYEHQIGLVREGQTVEATVEAFPGLSFPGRLAFLQPTLDPATRTVEVRFDLENPERRLRPGMFATVTLSTPVAETPAFLARSPLRVRADESRQVSLTVEEQKDCLVTRLKLGSMGQPIPVEIEGRKVWVCCSACLPKLQANPSRYLVRLTSPPRDQVLSIPESAVIDTGRRKVVYVEAEPGVFEGREVVLGPRIGDRFPVLEGLEPGERVASKGAFLIDAESRLNPGAAAAPSPTADAH